MATNLRDETSRVVDLADRDLRRLWRLVENGADAGEALHDLLPAIVIEYGALGAAMAAEWYERERLQADARGAFVPVPFDATDRGAHALVGAALATARSDNSLRVLVLGGVQRRIADHVRLTATNNAVADPGAKGWVRVGAGECDWCAQYIDGVVRTVAGYDFDAHDNCRCSVTVAF